MLSSLPPRSRSRHFEVLVPPLTPTQREGRLLSRSLPEPRAPLPRPASPILEDPKEEEEKEGVWKILVCQRSAGVEEDQYLVQLEEEGKRVRRTRTELQQLAPNLFAAFLSSSSQPTSPPPKMEVITLDTTDDEDAVVAPVPKAWKGKGKEASTSLSASVDEVRRRAREAKMVIEEKAGPSTSASGSVHEEEEEEASGTHGESFADGSDEDDEDGDDEDDEDFAGAKKLRRREPTKPTRQSSRARPRSTKAFDLELEDDEDDSSAASSAHPPRIVRRGSHAEESSASEDELMLVDTGSAIESSESEVESEGMIARTAAVVQRLQEAKGEREAANEEESGWVGGIRPQDQHRQTCAKCNKDPLRLLLPRFEARKKKKKKRGRRSRKSDDDLEDDTDSERERLLKLGAWMECGICILSYHFGCLPGLLQKEFTDVLKAEHEAAAAAQPSLVDPPPLALVDPLAPAVVPMPIPVPKRDKIELDMNRTFVVPKCWGCKKAGGRRCYECGVSGRKMEAPLDEPHDAMDVDGSPQAIPPALPLMFRCQKCKRCIHYECLSRTGDENAATSREQHAQSYFAQTICHQCALWGTNLEVILAWAKGDPLPTANGDVEEGDVRTEIEVVKKKDEKTGRFFTVPSAKDPTANAKYLVKWKGESYRQLEWVPHAFLAASNFTRLAKFLAKGSQVSFEPPKDDILEEGEEEAAAPTGSAPPPDPDAADRIPRARSTVDRVLDVWYKSRQPGGRSVRHSDYSKLPQDPAESIQLVSECYFKWGDLPYSDSTTEAPPEEGEDGYDEYKKAYGAFLIASGPNMRVPQLNASQLAELDRPREAGSFKPLAAQPSYITGKLMPFQIEGVNFLYSRWWDRKGCILADEMGLGKTVQIITLLSTLSHQQGARPFLITVPNSTLGNWVREFEQWAPTMRVVPYGGDAESRRIVEKFELFDRGGKNLKTHVVLATYEALGKNIAVFRKVARWDCLVVDEGQRLKSGDEGLLFAALQSLTINHRILLSGTPLNNNLGELFNLLHFIDPSKGRNTKEFKDQYMDLTPEKVEQIRELLKPHFMRRTKDLVLDLPPLTEIVVPVTVTPLQRQLYRSILERNAAAIESIFHQSAANSKVKVKKANFNNILMELRKLLGHPYLVSPDLEPRNVTPAESHVNLTEASAKLIFLSMLLPRLQAAGHRVLIFSQFKLTLNILEDFLGGLELNFLRLDGDTAQLDRQRGIDKFNAPGSDAFCYLLSTRAGGVGINLTTADTVVIFDSDFNPQQDIQAISRAHRIGQKKPVRVFRLLVKGTVEEKIFHQGQRKLGLDHLIVQQIDATDVDDDVEGILQYGAVQIFDDSAAESAAIHYNAQSIDALLARVADPPASRDKSGASSTFAHARIWEVEQGALVDVEGGANEPAADASFWQRILAQQEEAAKVQQAADEAGVGRGKRTRANVAYRAQTEKDSPAKKARKHPSASSGDEFRLVEEGDDSGDDEFHAPLSKDDRLINRQAPARPRKPASAISRSGSGTPQPPLPSHLGQPRPSSKQVKPKLKKKPSPMVLGDLQQGHDPHATGPSRPSSNFAAAPPFPQQAPSPISTSERRRLEVIQGVTANVQRLHDPELDKLLAGTRGTGLPQQTEGLNRAAKRVEWLNKGTSATASKATERPSEPTQVAQRGAPTPFVRAGPPPATRVAPSTGLFLPERTVSPPPVAIAGPPPAARAGPLPPQAASGVVDLTMYSDTE